jgi:hypothetical protein
MALGVGSIVAFRNYSDDLAAGGLSMLTWQSPMFGVIDAAVPDTDSWTVNWGDGTQEDVIDVNLDEIVDATDTNLIGHIVAVAGQDGSARFTVIAEYHRGTSEGSEDFVLGITETGVWRELAVSAVELIS